MRPETVARITEEQYVGRDMVLAGDAELRYGLGFGLPSARVPLPSPNSFFWGGWGGSLAVIDPDTEMTVTYVMNKMAPTLQRETRGGAVLLSAYGALMAGAA